MNDDRQKLSDRLDKVESLARASAIGRLTAAPQRYVWGQVFNKIIYPITKKERLTCVKTFFGDLMHLALPAGTDIYFTRGKSHDSEIRLARYFLKSIQEGDHVLDIGAHFGYFTLLAARLSGVKGKIYSFEPGKQTFAMLRENTSSRSEIKIFNSAMSDRQGTFSFYEFPAYYSEYNTLDVSQFEQENWFEKYKPEKIEVEALTIDKVTDDTDFSPNFIKIDVEGAENKVISGGLNYLKKFKPVIIMEYLSEKRGNQSHRDAAGILFESGYVPAIILNDGRLDRINPRQLDEYMENSGLESDNIVFL